MAKKLDEEQIATLVDQWITEAKQFDRSDLADHREWAIRFYDGETDVYAPPNRSQVVSHDIATVMGWIVPGLLRVFCSTDKVAIYEPETPDDVANAKDATDAVNYLFLQECDGYRVLHYAMHDGLLHGNGPLKVYWDGKPEYKTETLRGLTQEEFEAIASQPDVDEILEVESYDVGPDGQPLKDQDGDSANPAAGADTDTAGAY